MQKIDYKRLLIISEATFFDSGTGINRTLINLFNSYPKDKLLIACPKKYLTANPPNKNFKNNTLAITSRNHVPVVSILPGRVESWISKTNLFLLENFGINEIKKIKTFSPEVILLCTNSLECMLIAEQIKNIFSIPLYVYAMDDWQDHEDTVWGENNGKQLIHGLLRDASGWIMISEALQMSYQKRYEVKPRKIFIAHNPVDLNKDSKIPLPPINGSDNIFKVAYAGAVWPMHYDAIKLCAAAVKELRDSGLNIQLILYTDKSFWKMYQSTLLDSEVEYGGFINYSDLHQELAKADLLLAGSAFDEKYKHLSFTSVQTKLTDYMAAGRPILSIGPKSCACNQFVEKWKCGLIFDSEIIEDLKALLHNLVIDNSSLENIGKQGFEAAVSNFSCEAVIPKLYSFLSGQEDNKNKLINKIIEEDTDTLSWQSACRGLSFDKSWNTAVSYLTEEERERGISLKTLWSVLDKAWFELKQTDPLLNQQDFLNKYYQHPVWLLLGAFSESDSDTIQDRLAAVRLITSVRPQKILDFGGGIGTACRLAAREIRSANTIDLVDIGPFSETIKHYLQDYPKIRVLDKPDPLYDAVMCTEVLEHLIDPIGAVITINRLLKNGGALALSYSFAPGIACHLEHNFHLKHSMLWIIRSLGFGFYGFERRGSTVFSFIKNRDVNKGMIKRANILFSLSKYKFPVGQVLTAIKGL